MGTCSTCGLARFDGPAGYVGPMCTCAHPGAYGFPRYAIYPSEKKEPRRYGDLTESDIRRIVRDELEAAKKEGRDA